MAELVFLGRFQELAGAARETAALPPSVRTLAGLRDWMAVRWPEVAAGLGHARAQIAINQEIVRDPAHPIRDEDEIAFLPPMSGG